MSEFVNNPWVVGIGAGLLSSLLVAIVTRYIFSKRDNREYNRRVAQANQEVLYAIRPGISEGVIPKNEVLRRLVAATSRRYGLEPSALFGLDEIAAELSKEVMDSSFISAATKEEFCEKLSDIQELQTEPKAYRQVLEYDRISRYRWQMVSMLSLMVGMMTAIAGFWTTIAPRETTLFSEPKQLFILIVPAAVAILAATLTVFLRELRRLRLRRLEFRFGALRANLSGRDSSEKEQQSN